MASCHRRTGNKHLEQASYTPPLRLLPPRPLTATASLNLPPCHEPGALHILLLEAPRAVSAGSWYVRLLPPPAGSRQSASRPCIVALITSLCSGLRGRGRGGCHAVGPRQARPAMPTHVQGCRRVDAQLQMHAHGGHACGGAARPTRTAMR